MDASMPDGFNLGDGSLEQFKAIPEAVDLLRSKWPQLAEDSEAYSEEGDSEDELSEGEQSDDEQEA
ncbi:hypothetical protein BGZ74_000856 [Mortierella antarctica]|nr:hypothetical protein BGZ74_000856 [Mortierella antarctica]